MASRSTLAQIIPAFRQLGPLHGGLCDRSAHRDDQQGAAHFPVGAFGRPYVAHGIFGHFNDVVLMSIAVIPLATAVTAYFVAPIIAVVLSLIFLKERLTIRKFLSLILGFGGAMVILKPTGGVELGILLAFGAGAFFALYMIATGRHRNKATQ